MSSVHRITFWSSGDPGSIPGRGELCAPAVPQPMNQNERLVPHLKVLICICLEPEAQMREMTFRVLYAISKRPYFPYEMPKSRVSLQATVS